MSCSHWVLRGGKACSRTFAPSIQRHTRWDGIERILDPSRFRHGQYFLKWDLKKSRQPEIFKWFEPSEMFKAEGTSLTAKFFWSRNGKSVPSKTVELAQVAGCYSPCSKLLDTKWSNQACKLLLILMFRYSILKQLSNPQRTADGKWKSETDRFIYIYTYTYV